MSLIETTDKDLINIKMKKVIKKTKKVAKKPIVKGKLTITGGKISIKTSPTTPTHIVSNECPVCKGIGLARPEYVGSEKCSKCEGNGFIN